MEVYLCSVCAERSVIRVSRSIVTRGMTQEEAGLGLVTRLPDVPPRLRHPLSEQCECCTDQPVRTLAYTVRHVDPIEALALGDVSCDSCSSSSP